MRRLFNLLLGYVILRAEGEGVAKLLNLAVSRGIIFWDVHRWQDKIYFSTYPDNFPLLRPLSRKAGCSLRIHGKGGFPFLFYRFKRRRGLVAGFLFFILFLYAAGSFIWFIEISGYEELPPEELLLTARDLGLTPGTPKRRLDFAALEREFLLAQERLAWVGLEIRGTKLFIQVAEKIPPEEDFREGASDLVARRDGLIEKILVLSGEARVAPGDTVEQGEVLISGRLKARYQEGEELIERDMESVRARGEVWARVWYEFFSQSRLVEYERERTGSRTTAYTLKVPGREVRLGPQASPYRNYEREEIKRQLKWRNLDTPIEFMTIYYYELAVTARELSRDEALFKAREELFAKAYAALPPKAEIAGQELEELPPSGQDELRLRLVIETRENIAEEREHKPKEESTD